MPRRLLPWVAMLCALACVVYRAEARTVAADRPQQANDGGYISGEFIATFEFVPRTFWIEVVTLDGRGVGGYGYEAPDWYGLVTYPYSIGPLEPGSYRLKVHTEQFHSLYGGPNFTDSWYDRVSTAAASTPVTVTAGMTMTVDIDLMAFGEISGAVEVQQTRQPVKNYSKVSLTNEVGEVVASTETYDGRYSFRNVGAGTYTLSFTGIVEPDEWSCNPKLCHYQGGEQVYDPLTVPQKVTIGRGERIDDADVTLSLFGQSPLTFTYLPFVARSSQPGDRTELEVITNTTTLKRSWPCEWQVTGIIENTSPYTLEDIAAYGSFLFKESQGSVGRTLLRPGEQTTFDVTAPNDECLEGDVWYPSFYAYGRRQ